MTAPAAASAMEAPDWQTAILSGLSAIAGGLLGHQRFRRQASKDDLERAENAGGASYITRLERDRDAAIQRADAAWALVDRGRDEISAMKVRGALRDEKVERLEHQVTVLTQILLETRPELAPLLAQFGFTTSETRPPIGHPEGTPEP